MSSLACGSPGSCAPKWLEVQLSLSFCDYIYNYIFKDELWYWLGIDFEYSTQTAECAAHHTEAKHRVSHTCSTGSQLKKIQTQFCVAVLISKAEVPRIHSFHCEPSRQMEDRAQLWIRNGLVVEYRVCNSLSQENRVSLSLAIFGAEHSSSSSTWTNYATIMKTSCLTREGT